MYNLQALSPEEKDELLAGLLEEREGHADAPQDAAMLEPVMEAIKMLTGRVEELERLVLDELFGGIEKLYNENKRAKGIEGLKGKYGELFAPHMDALQAIEPDADVFEKIYDLLADQPEEQWEPSIQGYASTLAEKLAKIKGVPMGSSSVEVEIATPAEAEEKPAEEDGFASKIRRMAKASRI